MTRSSENRCFRRFQETRDPRLLGKVFDATAAELLRVAGHLANGDRELTQDALQATFLTAIEQADSYDTERDVRPWLLGILANHVRKERRRTVRQRGADVTEQAIAAKDSPVADVQLAEFGTAAKAAMKQLPPPFREAIMLHLQHGLSAKDIGEALGRPAGTVRTQIVRGMDRLRALLPAGFTAAALGMVLTPGPILAEVRRNVLASLPAAAIGSSSLALTGWRLYAMIAAGVTLVLSVLGSWWTEPVAPPAELAGGALHHSAEVVSVDVATTRELVADSGEQPKVQKRKRRAPVDPDLQRIALKVVYADGKPADRAPIGVFMKGSLKTWVTDERGRLDLFLPWPGLHWIYALGTNESTFVTWHRGERRSRVVKKRLVIKAGMTLDLKVVDAAGKPIPDAVVETAHGFNVSRTRLTILGKTDADGRFRRQHVAAREASVRVWADGYQPSKEVDVGTAVGQVAEKTITLTEVGHTVRGVVVDEKGEPIPAAELALVQLRGRPKQPQFFVAGPDGRFELGTLGKGRHVIVGQHFGKELRRGQVRFAHPGGDAVAVQLKLARGAKIVGTLRNDSGRSYAGTNLVARDRPEAVSSLPFLSTWTKSTNDGTFVFDALVPGTYALESDHVTTKVITVGDGEVHEWNPVRTALQPVKVQLLDALGKPLSGWRMALLPQGQDWASVSIMTGDDGRMTYEMSDFQLQAGSYFRLALYQPQGKNKDPMRDFGRIPNLITPPMLVGVDQKVRVPATSATLHRIVGRVVDQDGLPITNATVNVRGQMRGQGGPSCKTDADGRFVLEDVPAGRRSAYVSFSERPSFSLSRIVVGPSKVMELPLIKIPRSGRIRVSLPAAAAAAKSLGLKLMNARGSRQWLRKQKDGTWRSDELYYGKYQVIGWTDKTWAPTCEVDLNKKDVAVDVAFVPHKATKLTVQLPHDYARNSYMFGCDLTARQNGKVVYEGYLSYGFNGEFQNRMEFRRSLPPGQVELEVVTWNKRKGHATITVPEAGGGEAVLRIE